MAPGSSEPRSPEALLASFAPRVYGLLYRLVGRPDVAEDLTQETLLRALRGLGSYRPEGKFRAWLFRIAVNLARDWIRRQPRQPAVGLDELADPPAAAGQVAVASPESDLARSEQAARVEAAVARLSAADREVILLRFYGGLAFKDIARATGEPIGTVLARAHRALRKLGDLVPEDAS